MEENVFGSLEEIDAALDENFGQTTGDTEEVNQEAPVSEETKVETEEVSEEKPVEEQKEANEDVAKEDDEGSKVSKKDYAFAQLRTENSDLKRERDGYKADSDYLKDLAASYGYDDVSKFQEAIRVSKYQREAQEKGYDPELYKRTMEQERRIAELEKEREQEAQERKLERFKSALDNAVATYGIETQEIFDRLDASGISVEAILNVDNPKILLDGLLVDKIKNYAEQSQLESLQNLKNLAEDKNEQGGSVQAVTIDSLIENDMAKYKKDNYFD